MRSVVIRSAEQEQFVSEGVVGPVRLARTLFGIGFQIID